MQVQNQSRVSFKHLTNLTQIIHTFINALLNVELRSVPIIIIAQEKQDNRKTRHDFLHDFKYFSYHFESQKTRALESFESELTYLVNTDHGVFVGPQKCGFETFVTSVYLFTYSNTVKQSELFRQKLCYSVSYHHLRCNVFCCEM